MTVCGNTAAMVGEKGISWLSPHFQVIGDRSVHYGLFADCGPTGAPTPMAPAEQNSGSSCCG